MFSATATLPSGKPRSARQPRTVNHTRSWYHARPVRAALAVLRLCAGPTVALCVACSRPAQGPLPGASDAWAKPSEAQRPLAPPPPTWDAYASVKQWSAVNTAPFTSRGHQPERQVDVRVSPESRATYTELVADSVFPDGSVLAELSHSGDGRGYGMRKVGGSWSFFELDAQGGVLASGALALCAGCHAQAPADSVFGLPREVPEPH
jgi:hypothetical protein